MQSIILTFLLLSLLQNSHYHCVSSLQLFKNINKNIKSNWKSISKQIKQQTIALIIGSNFINPINCEALTYPLNNPIYHKSIINLFPSDDFWLPPYLIGQWKTKLTFNDAKFSDKVKLDEIALNNISPGFSKYSVFSIPTIGKDFDTILRYVQVDSHTRQDHSFNTRNLVTNNEPNTIVDSVPYNYQLTWNILNPPANKQTISYHDNEGNGIIHLNTIKRDINIVAGSVETIEFIEQIHERTDILNNKKSVIKSDYAFDWKLSVPESLRDEFITSENLSKTKILIGNLDILVYLQPTNDLYLKVPAQPVGVFSYNVEMERIIDSKSNNINENINNEVKKTEYPFVSMDDGAVELQKFFGY